MNSKDPEVPQPEFEFKRAVTQANLMPGRIQRLPAQSRHRSSGSDHDVIQTKPLANPFHRRLVRRLLQDDEVWLEARERRTDGRFPPNPSEAEVVAGDAQGH